MKVFGKKMLEMDETSLKPVIISDDGVCFLYK
jgi:hypothetical protein